MRTLLSDLAATNLLRVTGSFADGTQTEASDIDFYIKPDKPDIAMSDRNILKIINILKAHNITWDSTSTGYIFTHKSVNNLSRQLEFSDLYDKRPNRLPLVVIEGVEFKTY